MTEFPEEFDVRAYIDSNADLRAMNPREALDHFEQHGRYEGRVCSDISERQKFIDLVGHSGRLLEIGPYINPAFRRPDYAVSYLDAFSTAELVEKANATGDSGVPEIDYVWRGEDYKDIIDQQYERVFSSHNIEHHPDLINHLQQIGTITTPGAYLFLAVPDRRYCFDHFLPDTTFADVLSAHLDKRVRHVAGSLLEHRLMTTHNEAERHWSGDHGENPLAKPFAPGAIRTIRTLVEEFQNTPGYLDTHAWQFTPSSFRSLIDTLYATRFIPFAIERIYPTIRNTNEFYVILKRHGKIALNG